MPKRPKAIEIVSYGRNLLWMVGLYHGKRLKKHCLYGVNRTAYLLIFYLFPLFILLQVFQSDFGLMTFLQRSSFFMTTLWCANKSVLHIYNMDKLYVIEEELETDIFNIQTKQQDRYMWEVKTTKKFVLRFYWYFLYFFTFSFISYPIISGHFFVISMWNPFGSEISSYLFQSCYFSLGAFVYPLLDTASVGLVFMVAAQYKILKDNLRNICKGSGKDIYPLQENRVQERLRKCIIHHNAIMKLSSKIEDLLSPMFFWQVAFSVLQLCFTGIQLIAATELAQIGFLIGWLTGLILVIFLMCWCGQEIINQIHFGCCPVLLGAKWLLGFLLQILRRAYTYYALFSQIYQN